MKLLVMNGPNLNFLGIREPDKYGTETYDSLLAKIRRHCADRDIEISFYQSNHEGDLVDAFQKAYFDKIDAIVINPGAYTHTSIALLDAARSVQIPLAEVHITDIATRAFAFNTSIQEIYLPDSVQTFGESAFNGCTNLTKLVLPAEMTSWSP